MAQIMDEFDHNDLETDFGVDALWYAARLSPEQRNGTVTLQASAVHGFLYAEPEPVRLIRTNVSYRMIASPEGRIYEGGARFTVLPTHIDREGIVQPVTMFSRLFKGDVIVVQGQPIRDFDVLTRGRRERLFAFDVLEILSLTSFRADKTEVRHQYGTDYRLVQNGQALSVSVTADGGAVVVPTEAQTIVSDTLVEWLPGGVAPREGVDYTVEFICSPNYIIWDDVAKIRGTHDAQMPKTVMAVKRAWANKDPNLIDGIQTNQEEVLEHYNEHLDGSNEQPGF